MDAMMAEIARQSPTLAFAAIALYLLIGRMDRVTDKMEGMNEKLARLLERHP